MAESLPDPLVRGLSLSRWVTVEAALAEGLPLGGALAEIGWTEGRFRGAATGWKLRMVDEASLFPSYQAHLAAAQDRLTRPVLPIDSDLAGWVGFLKAFEGAADAGAWLTGLGLRASDLARLSRRWQGRLSQDPKLAAQAQKLAQQNPPPPFPVLQIGRHALAPAAVSDAPGASPEALGWDLWRWASIQAELGVFSSHRAAVLARHALSDESSYAALEAGFAAVLAQDAQLRADFQRLFGHAERRLRAFADGPPPSRKAPHSRRAPSVPASTPALPAPSVAKDLRETAHLGDVMLRAALPFADGAVAAPPRVHFIRARSPLSGHTGDLPKLAARPTLPFSIPNKLASTAPSVDAPREALPFAKPKSKLAQTNMALNVPRHLFANASEPPPPPAAPASVPPTASASVPPAAPLPMPLLRHASLHAELALFPDKRADVLLRYRVSEDELQRADRYFQERVAKEPETHRAWHNGYHTYAAWLRGGG